MIPEWYHQNFEALKSTLQNQSRLYVALSAGVDSQVLIDWLHHFKKALPPIEALHVNHLLHGEYSYIWADFAKAKALAYGFEFTNFEVAVNPNDPKGVEAAGREARYLKMAHHMCENSALLVAHHQSDQAETLLFRLIRGAGVRGLGAMKSQVVLAFSDTVAQENYSNSSSNSRDQMVYVNIIRPFLNISKNGLIEAAQQRQLEWMDDYTNTNLLYARNQIRNGIFPEIARYFPHYEAGFAKSAQFLQEAQSLLDEIAASDAITAIDAGRLVLAAVQCLSDLRQNNILRYWLHQHHMTLNELQLAEIKKVFLSHGIAGKSVPPHSKFVLKDRQIRIHEAMLCMVPVKPEFIDRIAELEINQYITLSLTDLVDAGILSWQNSPEAPPLSWWLQQKLVLKSREGGERFDPIFRHKSQQVKKILQEINLPQWHREYMYYLENEHHEIVWMTHLGISKKIAQTHRSEGKKTGVIPCFI